MAVEIREGRGLLRGPGRKLLHQDREQESTWSLFAAFLLSLSVSGFSHFSEMGFLLHEAIYSGYMRR